MADTFVEDVDLYPLMVELLSCLCVELEDSGLPKPCRCSLMPGDLPVLDFGSGEDGCKDGCGQAWVRLVTAFPADQFPIAAVQTASRCDVALAYQLEIGVSRCETVGRTVGGRFIPPSAEDQLDSVRLYTADMAAMRRAMLCCFRSAHARTDDLEIALGAYTPLPTQGGVGGGTWALYLRRQ